MSDVESLLILRCPGRCVMPPALGLALVINAHVRAADEAGESWLLFQH
jgi:hypothetical protein